MSTTKGSPVMEKDRKDKKLGNDKEQNNPAFDDFIHRLEVLQKEIWDRIHQGPFWSALRDRGLSQGLYVELMTQIFHYTRHNSQNQALAVRNVNSDRLPLLKFCLSHAKAEAGHDLMVLNDLATLGISPETIKAKKPLPETEGFIAYVYRVSTEKDATARLGYSYWAEGCYPFIKELTDAMVRDLKLTDEQMTFFKEHSEIDIAHLNQVKDIIRVSVHSVEQQHEILEVLENTLLMTGQILDGAHRKFLQDSPAETLPAKDIKPVYSEVMEDYLTIAKALRIQKDEGYITVASGGDNAFNAVLEPVKNVYAVDINPAQIAYCRLKEAAIQHLEWKDFAKLMGLLESSSGTRMAILEDLIHRSKGILALSGEAKEYFSRKGLLRSSHLEEFVQMLREGLARIVGPDKIDSILSAEDAEERKRIWMSHFETPELGKFLSELLNEKTISGSFIPGWAFDRMAENPFSKFFHHVLKHQLVEGDPADNYHIHRMITGRFPSIEAVQPYLQEKNYPALKNGIGKVGWFTCDLTKFLETLPPGGIAAFNLSNILDWKKEGEYRALWAQIDRVSPSGARVFLRSFLAQREIPAELTGRWTMDGKLAKELRDMDRVGYYSRCEQWIKA